MSQALGGVCDRSGDLPLVSHPHCCSLWDRWHLCTVLGAIVLCVVCFRGGLRGAQGEACPMSHLQDRCLPSKEDTKERHAVYIVPVRLGWVLLDLAVNGDLSM